MRKFLHIVGQGSLIGLAVVYWLRGEVLAVFTVITLAAVLRVEHRLYERK